MCKNYRTSCNRDCRWFSSRAKSLVMIGELWKFSTWIHSSKNLRNVITHLLTMGNVPNKFRSWLNISFISCAKFGCYCLSLKILFWIHSSKKLQKSITPLILIQNLQNKLQSQLCMFSINLAKFGCDWWRKIFSDLNPFKQKTIKPV